MALPRESRFAPLVTDFLDCREVLPKRRHSFGGYIPYHLSEEARASVGPWCKEPDTKGACLESDLSDACSTTSLPDSDDDWQRSTSQEHSGASISSRMDTSSDLAEEVDAFWPDTDDEWERLPASEHGMPVPVPQIRVPGPAMLLLSAAVPAIPGEQAPKVVRGLGKALSQAAAKHDMLRSPALPSCYHFIGEPSLKIEEYVLRLHKLCAFSQNCFVYALAYISKAVETNPQKVSVDCQTVHRLVLAALTVAAKYHDDRILSNDAYARAGGVDVEDLNTLESNFLELLAWKLGVEDTVFKRIQQLLEMSS